MAETTLRLEGVTGGYGGPDVIRDLSLAFAPGELIGLLGANGCGKTTLLRIAAGVLRPTDGRVMLDGRDVAGWTPREVARRIGPCCSAAIRGIRRSPSRARAI